MSRLRPKIGTAKLTDKEKEKYFIGLYVKEGAIDEKIPYAEQRASLEPGAGHRILRRKRVQEEIKARTEPVRFEQMRQCVLGEAIVHAKAALQEELVKTAAMIRGRAHNSHRLNSVFEYSLLPPAARSSASSSFAFHGRNHSSNGGKVYAHSDSEKVKKAESVRKSAFAKMARS